MNRLDAWRSDWRSQIDAETPEFVGGFPPNRLSDRRVFEAFTVALLSGNARWDRIAAVRPALSEPFHHYDLARFAALSDVNIDQTLVPWFARHRAGSAGLAQGLRRLRRTATVLEAHGSYEYLRDVFAAADGSPDRAAVLLGHSSQWKLPGFGIALAAEALRLLGFDLSKPDRHVLRALGSWDIVAFSRWDRKGEFTAPQARPKELASAMTAVRALAADNEVGTSVCTSVIWTAGAVSGARLTNAEFAALAMEASGKDLTSMDRGRKDGETTV
ncbi:hypothetical protein FPZ24_04285 [Sphingomonas panacisoli]|uniref:3-methyladenine DNA glycosylase n=1 Tax=Sphingomonas panacisoli TaxID=1813879 RepID=A0A5B8LFY5_9SPHN|nr:hypothetical protein [Sphingomonas panacisoli]QDZ06789.1 hypothetical protein FPZ24_04285 [Sphingomonas panacisoli]